MKCEKFGKEVPIEKCAGKYLQATSGPCLACPTGMEEANKQLAPKEKEETPVEKAKPNAWMDGNCIKCGEFGKVFRKKGTCSSCNKSEPVPANRKAGDERFQAISSRGMFLLPLLEQETAIFEHVTRRAKQEYRTLENQILWMLRESSPVKL